MTKSISILGATGSIGTSTLDLIERDPEQFSVVSLTAQSDVKGLASAARRTNAQFAAIGDENLYGELKQALAGTTTEIASGKAALVEAASRSADWTMAAIVGCAGLAPVLAVLQRGGVLALANKEALVSAGQLMLEAAQTTGATLLPVDSEHNAIFQCLEPENLDRVRRLILTASGGPFRTLSLEEMRHVTPAQAVRHPNWSMGAKISVDSATMMNKGLELIEAHYLYPVGADRLDVIIHPQSVIHSLVEYQDGSLLAQMGTPDMRIPIAHCLAWPSRMAVPLEPLDLAAIATLTFEKPDELRFPCLRLAREAMCAGGASPAILNAANETAVAAFLAGQIGFLDIALIVGKVLESYAPSPPKTLEDIFAIDHEARCMTISVMDRTQA